ncbi:MAG: right-handed parallel beta-helix repeat-containing protein [Candidatus Rokuibacteriota bacterium]
MSCFGIAGLVLGASPVSAATIHLNPGSSFELAVESLNPGDTLIVHAGTYADSGRISITVRGTPTAPVVIMGAPGEARPVITRASGATAQNTINVEGATNLTIRGIEITGIVGDGINLSGNPSNILLEDLLIHDVDVGINFRSSASNVTVRRNHIFRTGIDGGTGEGLYVGCHEGTCAVTNSLIEGNWIHDTRASSQGDGIEIKRGSHSNIIRDNVIHDTQYPCIILYGTDGNPPNLVEGNVMWNCDDSGMQAAADSIIRNNIILATTGGGFTSQNHAGVTPANLQFIHNTIIGGSPCLRLNSWSGKTGLVFANNAVYCGSGGYAISGVSGVTVSGNVILPSTSQLPSSGYIVGRSTASDFIDAAGRNTYPTSDSKIVDAGAVAFVTPFDFNWTPRAGVPDAGAYTLTTPPNPGWIPVPGFKPLRGTDTAVPTAPGSLRVQ